MHEDCARGGPRSFHQFHFGSLFHTEAFVSFVFDLASGTCMFLALL